MSSTHHSSKQQHVPNKDHDDSSLSSLYISPPVSSPHIKANANTSISSNSSNSSSNDNTSSQQIASSIEKDAEFHQVEPKQQNLVKRKRRSETTDRYVVDFGEIDARLMDTLNQPSASGDAIMSNGHGRSVSSQKKRRKSATPANQHFITDYFKQPVAALVSAVGVIKHEDTTTGKESKSPLNQQHKNSSSDPEQMLNDNIEVTLPQPHTPRKCKRARGAPVEAAFKTPKRGRAVLEVPSSTPGLSPITKASLSAAAMVATGVGDLSFVSPTPRARWSKVAPVVPPFRITPGNISGEKLDGMRIGSVVAASVWEDYEEVGVNVNCAMGSETDEDYLSDNHTHEKQQRKRLERDRIDSLTLTQLQPIQGRAREPQYEKELQISGSSSRSFSEEDEADTEPEDEIESEFDKADMEIVRTKLASESICSTVSSIRSPLCILNPDQKHGDVDDDEDPGSVLSSSLEFPCAQRASESVYSCNVSSFADDNKVKENGFICGTQHSMGKKRGDNLTRIGIQAGTEADNDDIINSSADDEVLRVWAEQRQQAPPAFLLLESRYDPVDDRSFAADSEAAAAAAAVMAAVAAEEDLFSPRRRHRSSQSFSQSLGPCDSINTMTTAGGNRRTGERYPYSTQRPLEHDTEAEDNDMSDVNDVKADSDRASIACLNSCSQQQNCSSHRHQVTMPFTQHLQFTQAQPIPVSQYQNQQQQILTNEASQSTQYYVDHILTTSMLESLPLPELQPSSSSPAHMRRHAPNSHKRREWNQPF